MNPYFNRGYEDGLRNAGDEAREDTIDELSLSDGWLAASDYEDGYQDGYEDRDYDSGYDGDWDGDGDYDY